MAKKQDNKQKTETKNNGETQVDDALVKTSEGETEVLSTAPKKATYLEVFTTAQEKCVASLKALEKNAAEEEVIGLRRLVKSAQPVVRGREEMTNKWNIPVVRVVYGTTKDPAKPSKAQPGDMYSSNGRIVPQHFEFTPLYIFENNKMYEQGQNVPVCWSPDAKLGTMFGLCKQCAHEPLGKNPRGETTDCNNGISMVVMSRDWKIYRIDFFKTSRKAGAAVDRLVQSQDVLWERWFDLTTQATSSNGYDYFVMKTAATGEDLEAVQVEAADVLYSLIKVEREASLEAHYNNTLSASTATVQEGADMAALGVAPDDSDDDTNPEDVANSAL